MPTTKKHKAITLYISLHAHIFLFIVGQNVLSARCKNKYKFPIKEQYLMFIGCRTSMKRNTLKNSNGEMFWQFEF